MTSPAYTHTHAHSVLVRSCLHIVKITGKHTQKTLYYHFNNNNRISEQDVDSLMSHIHRNVFFPGILLVDFVIAFDVANHSLMLRKRDLYPLSPEISSFI